MHKNLVAVLISALMVFASVHAQETKEPSERNEPAQCMETVWSCGLPYILLQERRAGEYTPRGYVFTSKMANDASVHIFNVFGAKKGKEAFLVAFCESGLNPRAYNPEIEAKKAGKTKYSSCGVFQINSPLCKDDDQDGLLDPDSSLADYKTNIAEAYKLYQERAWDPWRSCGIKYGLL